MAYRVPFVNYPLQYSNLKSDIDSAIQGALGRGDLILRSDVEAFESDFARLCGRKYGISVGSCTGAMFLSLKAAGVGRGDEVITVSHTYIATIDVIVDCGATPVLVDVGDDYNMDAGLLLEAVTKKTKAILPVHLNGRVCNMDEITSVARENNLFVVEDAAQAVSAKFDGKPAGSFGLTGCFSFYPAKILGCFGDGGMIVTDDAELADKLYLLRDHGERPKYRGDSGGRIPFFGFNTMLDNIQAAVLNVKLKHLPKWIRRRREIAGIYNDGLKGLPLVLPPPPETGGFYHDVFQNYVVRSSRRDRLQEHLKMRGVETLIHWRIPNHLQDGLGLNHFKLPKTERISTEVISLPTYPELTDEQVEYVIECVRDFHG